MFVEPLLGARPSLAMGDSEGSDLAPVQGTQDPQGDDTGEVTSGARMQVCTASCCGDTERAHSSFRELKKGCLEEMALSRVLED